MTLHLAIAQNMLDETMSTPEGAAALHLVSQGLRGDYWEDAYVDSIGQLGSRSRSSWPMDQIAAFAVVHGMVHTGGRGHGPGGHARHAAPGQAAGGERRRPRIPAAPVHGMG